MMENAARRVGKADKAERNDRNDRNERKSEYLKNKRKLKKAGSGLARFLFVLFMLMVVITVFFFLTNKYFFKVHKILIADVSFINNGYSNNADENYSKYSYDDILSASGITVGSELYGIDVKQVKNNIKKRLTYVDNINIIRIPPSTVSIEIKTDRGMFGIKLGGDYYIISENFRVVEKIDIVGGLTASGVPGTAGESDFMPPDGIITVAADTVKKCCVGEKIEFSDSDITDFLKETVKMFKEYDLTETMSSMNIKISSINIKDKFNVVMNYGDRFLVKFGVFENISPKVLNSLEIINRIPEGFKGIIDITNEKVASFEYDDNILKNKLYYNVKVN